MGSNWENTKQSSNEYQLQINRLTSSIDLTQNDQKSALERVDKLQKIKKEQITDKLTQIKSKHHNEEKFLKEKVQRLEDELSERDKINKALEDKLSSFKDSTTQF